MKGVWLALFVAVLLPPKAASSEKRTPEYAQRQEDVRSWQTEWAALEPQLARLDPGMFFACARNALYVFLHLSGNKAISFDEVKAVVPLTAPYGTSLKSLLEAARKLGCDAEVRLYNSRDFDSVPLPAVVHISNSPIMAYAHFDVMYKRDSEWVYLIDGTTAQQYKVRRTKFGGDDWWTGYALVQKRSIFAFVVDECWPALGAAFLVTDIALLIWRREFKRRRGDCP